MDDFKFRAWNGTEIINSLLINCDDECISWLDGNLNGSEPHAWKEEGLMQCTNIKSSDGVDIYEGDFIKCAVTIGVVTRYRGAFGIKHKNVGFAPFFELVGYDFTILGNIYETPELGERG